MKILVVSFLMPSDRCDHAGGKTHNYYLKKIAACNDMEVRLVSIAKDENDIRKYDLDKYGIDSKIYYQDHSVKTIFRRAINQIEKIFPSSKYYGQISYSWRTALIERVKKYKNEGFFPDVVITEWTYVSILIDEFKRIFPNAKYIASEHDVAYLRLFRQIELEKTPREKHKAKALYLSVKQLELESLKKFDLIYTHNEKDLRILVNDGISRNKLFSIVPYYSQELANCNYKNNKRDIVFFGQMSRPDNYLSAIWFINEVMPKLKDLNIRLILLGSNPPRQLKELERENIVVTGFVDDIRPYFENCLCMVAPLILGAGIKVKVLEGLCAGVPLITNDIGIEGINAIPGVDYLHYETNVDLANDVKKLYMDENLCNKLAKNSRNFMINNYNLEESGMKYCEIIRGCSL